MKVVHISTYKNGGAGIAAYRLHLGLLEKGVDSSFIIKSPAEVTSFDKNTYVCEPYYPFTYKIKKRLRLANDDLFWEEIKKHPIDYDIVTLPIAPFRIENHPLIQEADIIHLHWVSDFINYPTFFQKVDKPIVWTLHDLNTFSGIFHYQTDLKRNNQALASVDNKALRIKNKSLNKKKNITIVTPSEWLMALSKASSLLSKFRHYTIANGMDIPQQIDRKDAKLKLGLYNNKKTILFIANEIGSYRKGFDLLIKAINNISQTDFNIISVGQGIEQIAFQFNSKHLHYDRIDNRSELNNIYSAADVTILPSREDNLPNVMLESLSNGTPVISFSNGGMAEHIKTGFNGILVKGINYEALSARITDFINEKYTFDSGAIREYAINEFSDTKQTKAYIQLYRNILNQ